MRIYLGLAILLIPLVACAPRALTRAPAREEPQKFGGAGLVADWVKGAAKREGREAALRVEAATLGPILAQFLRVVPLEKDVRKRIADHLKSDALGNRLIPLVSYLKRLYLPRGKVTDDNFDAYVRRGYSQSDQVPGIEHDFFRWVAPAKEGAKEPKKSSGAAIDKETIASVLKIYDAIYLLPGRGFDQPAQADTRTVERVRPVLRQILTKLLPKLEGTGDIQAEVKEVIEADRKGDSSRLTVVTGVLVSFIEDEIQKHFVAFQNHSEKSDALKRLLGDMLSKNDPALWRYLRKAVGEGEEKRKYAVQIVIDGLQGHMVEAFSTGNDQSPFIRRVAQEYSEPQRSKPRGVSSESFPPDQQKTRFLKAFSSRPYQDRYYLPFFRQLYQEQRNGIAKNGISTTPTISVRNIPIAISGAPVAGPGSTGLPNFHFLDRKPERPRPYYFYGTDSQELDSITRKNGMRTLFNRLSSDFLTMNCHAPYDGGADTTFDGFLNLAVGESARDWGDVRCLNELEKRAKTERKLNGLRREALSLESKVRGSESSIARRRLAQLLGQIAELEDQGMPQYLLYYSPWVDHFSHFKGPFSDEILSPSGELNRLDFWLSRIRDVYRDAGILDSTLFAMAGDHGMTPVFHRISAEKAMKEYLEARNIKPKIIKISSDEGEGPKINDPKNPVEMHGYDLVVASTAGGNQMIDLFVDQNERWREQPVLSQLRSMKTQDGAKTYDAIRSIAEALADSLEYLVVRETPCGVEGGKVRAIRIEKGREVDAMIERRGDRVRYVSLTDLLGVRRPSSYSPPSAAEMGLHQTLLAKCMEVSETDTGSWCTEDEWRALTSFTDLPDSVNQLAHLYDLDLPGTVNVFPRFGVGYNTKVPGRHAGEHFHEKDAFVGFWGAPVKARERVRSYPNGSIAVTVYEYLTGQATQGAGDGWGYPSALGDLGLK